VRCCYGEIAHGQQAHATGHAGAVHAGDQRYNAASRQPEQFGKSCIGLGMVEAKGRAGRKVGSRAEGLISGAREDDSPHVAFMLDTLDRIAKAAEHTGTDRVATRLPRYREPKDAAAALLEQF
jgi:hypothetical protein